MAGGYVGVCGGCTPPAAAWRRGFALLVHCPPTTLWGWYGKQGAAWGAAAGLCTNRDHCFAFPLECRLGGLPLRLGPLPSGMA
jgi:hypothetical protein